VPGTQAHRLPTTVVPSRYGLTIEPDLDAATFTGTEAVSVEVTEPVDEIVLHAKDLEVSDVWLEGPGGERLDGTPTLDTEGETLTIGLSATATVGPWTLHAAFSGVLNDKLVGFYRSTFTDVDGETRTLATTQFEAPYARWAFPCWDEPAFKAVFGVTLVVPEDLAAISNSAEVADEPTGDGRRRVTFADTMAMSTYLVAWVVGPLEITDPVDVDGVPLRVACPPGKKHLTDFALEVGAFSLRFLADWYGIPYPGDKVDLVAIPDFSFGAMENLGCITFRETALLLDRDRAPQEDLQRVTDVVAHELAHMWFGDLVTMQWWNGIWLNEAFATWAEMKTTDAYKPEWERWVDFGVSRSAAFDTDSLSTTRAIEYEVRTPADAEGMFDVLTYEKGSSVVRMLEQYLGAERFRTGIQHYLRTHSYANTETTDLWDAIEAATDEPVRATMDTWIFQAGHPVVTVELDDDRRQVRLAQRLFRYDADGADDTLFAIPVVLRVGRGDATEQVRVLLTTPDTAVDLGEPADWVLANHQGDGFYRVRYADDDLEALAARAQRDLSPLERYGLIEDEWSTVLSGASSTGRMLSLLRHFADETDLSVWQRIVGVFNALGRLVPDEARADLESRVRALVAPAARALGPEREDGEPERTSSLRATLFELLGTAGNDESVQAEAAALFDRLGTDADATDPAMAASVVRVVAARATEDQWEEIRRRAPKAPSPQETVRLLGALGDADDPALIARFCHLTLTDEIRSQDAPFLLSRALGNRANGPDVWSFIGQHWTELNERFPSPSIARMVTGVRTFTDPALARRVEAFLDEHPVPQGDKQVAQHRERMRVNVAVRERESARLAEAVAEPR